MRTALAIAALLSCSACISVGSRSGFPPSTQGDRAAIDLAEVVATVLTEKGPRNLHVWFSILITPTERRVNDRELAACRWANFGGGHHITRPDYDVAGLIALVRGFRARRPGVEVYLEPGEAIAIGTGVLVTRVLDLVRSGGIDVAILDTSATAHMPDVLEMPYRPFLRGPSGEPAGLPGATPHTYRLGGLTCLAGDVIGDYSFDRPLEVGDKLVFADMAHYTMVKNTTFNGVRLPSIAVHEPANREISVVRRFGYLDYKGRLS